MAGRSALTPEEWEALHRLSRGAPEALLVPATIMGRLVELGLATDRAGQRRVSDHGRQLILSRKHDGRS